MIGLKHYYNFIFLEVFLKSYSKNFNSILDYPIKKCNNKMKLRMKNMSLFLMEKILHTNSNRNYLFIL